MSHPSSHAALEVVANYGPACDEETTRALHRHLTHLECTLEETVSVGELHYHLARIAAVALTLMTTETGEAFLDTILAGANPQTALTFLDDIRDALHQQQAA